MTLISYTFNMLQPLGFPDRPKIISESRKSRPISLRINEQDLNLLKEKASKNGLPYQTMINVIIHRYVNDSFLDKDEIDKYLKFKKTI